jgi:hypothetical protein
VLTAALIAAVACPGPPAVLVDRRPGEVRTAVVACDGDRRVVVRRARLARPGDGSRIVDVDGAGGRVAWGELRYAGGVVTGHVRAGRISGGPTRSRTVFRRRARRASPRLEVVLTTRGELAWLDPRGRVLTAPIGGRARVLVRRGARFGLALEDDRTVRWRRGGYEERLGFADLRPWEGAGCPVRSRFRPAAESPELLVTLARYLTALDTRIVVRVCRRATGRDWVIAQSVEQVGNGTVLGVAGIAGLWVVLTDTRVSRYGPCEWTQIQVVHVLSGFRGRDGALNRCDPARTPSTATPLVVTERGSPAWIVRDEVRSALLTSAGNGVIELDSAAPDGLTGLTVEGGTLRWLHDGVPRSVVLD